MEENNSTLIDSYHQTAGIRKTLVNRSPMVYGSKTIPETIMTIVLPAQLVLTGIVMVATGSGWLPMTGVWFQPYLD